ncbi:MAG: hypothetical protein [Bacteriophage sp.]|nr:MAG: hypothetical protein [Bacteriophage sp.]
MYKDIIIDCLSGISWFYTMQDRITFVKLMIDIVNKEIINNECSKKKVKE